MAASAEAIFESREPVTLKTLVPSTPTKNTAITTTNNASPLSTTRINTRPLILVDNFPRDTTTVIIDPPRKGCSPKFLKQLYQFRTDKVVYMSCDPETQARDSSGIVAVGYWIATIQPFDLFPQTRYIECLATFEMIEMDGAL